MLGAFERFLERRAEGRLDAWFAVASGAVPVRDLSLQEVGHVVGVVEFVGGISNAGWSGVTGASRASASLTGASASGGS